MSVLMLNDFRRRGGAETLFNFLATKLDGSTSCSVETLTIDEMPIGWSGFHYLQPNELKPTKERYWRKHLTGKDLLHVHNFQYIGYAPFIVASKMGIPAVYTAHDYLPFCPRRTLMFKGKQLCTSLKGCFKCGWGRSPRWYVRMVAKTPIINHVWERKAERTRSILRRILDYVAIVSVSRELDRIYAEQGYETRTINNGLPDIFKFSDRPMGWHKNVLSLSRLSYEKGVDLLADVSGMLTGELLAFNRIHIDCLDDLGKIIYLGYATRNIILDCLSSTTAVVSASIWPEPFNLTLLDAMMFSKPVVATDVGGHKDIVEHGKTGFLVEPDVKEIAEACNYLLDDRETAKKMGRRGRKRFLSRFTIERCANEYLELYRSLI